MRASDAVALVAVISLVSLVSVLTSRREPTLGGAVSNREATPGLVQGGSLNPSVGGVWIGDQASGLIERWGKPSGIKPDSYPGEMDGSPSPSVMWIYPENEWIRLHQNRVQSLFATRHRIQHAEAILAGPGFTIKQVLRFWGPPIPDEYATRRLVSYQLAGQGATLSFEHDGSQCTGLLVVGDASVPGPKR